MDEESLWFFAWILMRSLGASRPQRLRLILEVNCVVCYWCYWACTWRLIFTKTCFSGQVVPKNPCFWFCDLILGPKSRILKSDFTQKSVYGQNTGNIKEKHKFYFILSEKPIWSQNPEENTILWIFLGNQIKTHVFLGILLLAAINFYF